MGESEINSQTPKPASGMANNQAFLTDQNVCPKEGRESLLRNEFFSQAICVLVSFIFCGANAV
jgi:hypothetical protein